MRAFKDSGGREWRIRLTLGSIDRVLDVCSVDLLEPFGGEPPTITRLRTDMRLLGRVLAEVMEADGDRALTVSELRDAFDADTKVAAWEALLAEWTDFFRRDGREEVAIAIGRHEEWLATAIAVTAEQVQRIDEAAIRSAIERGSSRASSASTPAT